MKKYYRGQILAIVLVVIIVGAIVALATYSRVANDAHRVGQEKSADIADSLSSSVINSMINVEEDDINALCSTQFQGSNECTIEGDIAIEALTGVDLSSLGNFGTQNVAEACENIKVKITKLTDNEFVDIERDSALEINTFKAINRENASGCSQLYIDFDMENSASGGGVLVTQIKAEVSNDAPPNKSIMRYVGFSDGDSLVYCFNQNDCVTPAVDSGHILNNSSSSISVTLGADTDSERVVAVRVHPFGGNTAITWHYNGTSCYNSRFKVDVEATCRGTFSGKSFILSDTDTAPPIFDYVLYDGWGDLSVDR